MVKRIIISNPRIIVISGYPGIPPLLIQPIISNAKVTIEYQIQSSTPIKKVVYIKSDGVH